MLRCLGEQADCGAWKKEIVTERRWQHGTPNPVGTDILVTSKYSKRPSSTCLLYQSHPCVPRKEVLTWARFSMGLSLAIREKFPFKHHHIIVAIQTDKNKQSLVWRGCRENALTYVAGGKENRHSPLEDGLVASLKY